MEERKNLSKSCHSLIRLSPILVLFSDMPQQVKHVIEHTIRPPPDLPPIQQSNQPPRVTYQPPPPVIVAPPPPHRRSCSSSSRRSSRLHLHHILLQLILLLWLLILIPRRTTEACLTKQVRISARVLQQHCSEYLICCNAIFSLMKS